MRDFDVVVIGGGINGLTVAAYLAKAGQRVAVLEARGQCGAHCDTVELGEPGFLHNTHAAWLVPALSPAMGDLTLDSFGCELLGTDVLFAKTFGDGTNVVQALDPAITDASVARASERDAHVQRTILRFLNDQAGDVLDLNQRLLYGRPDADAFDRLAALDDVLLRELGAPFGGDDVLRMGGFEVLETLFESEHVRTLPAALGEFTGQWPLHRRVGPLVLSLAGLAPMPVHTARGGSHALTHALVRCVLAHGGEIHTTCPVEKILVRDGRACGVRLSGDALYPNEEIGARVVVSNLTLVPTCLWLLGEDVIGAERARLVKGFDYDDPQLMGVHFALTGDPEFASAAHDPAIQRSWVGYLGGETLDELRSGLTRLLSGVIPDDVMGGWFIPTRADPSQAPPGGHTMFAWMSVPPCPRSWRGRRLAGWDAWRELALPLADAITERLEKLAPGFGKLVLERFVNTPLDQQNSNPSAIRGNMIGGSAIPEQYGQNRPLPGIVQGGASRSFLPGLYLSNSIHPYGATHLATGCIAANEVGQDLGCRDQDWWSTPPFLWFLQNVADIPLNRGVSPRWLGGAAMGGAR
ncbi:MAG: NAD(P)/FAD-dependent oxidoreductase [Deltaproteobacteria bacterium]|jgi:beta-carotene ketolase (CrtO type)|nr:NAD(P)/FAD-dependent oxidoreductase [Deltaproteobacteria bacterium]